MAAKKDDEYGLMIDRTNTHGSEYVEVYVTRRREEDGDRPLGISGDGEVYAGYGCPKHLLGLVLDGLGLYGFISDREPFDFIGFGVEFRNVYSMDERKLGRMQKAIKRVNARIEKDQAREPGDKFMSFAKALKLGFVVERVGPRRRDPEWRFMSVEEGRNRYRQMIEDAMVEVKARKAG